MSRFPFFSEREAGSWRVFASTPSGPKPWLRWWSLFSRREPSSWLRFLRWATTAVLFIFMKSSGSWRPVIDLSLLNLIVLKIRHPERCVSASSDASEIQIVSSVHGVRQNLPIQGSLLWSLRGSSGLHAVMVTD